MTLNLENTLWYWHQLGRREGWPLSNLDFNGYFLIDKEEMWPWLKRKRTSDLGLENTVWYSVLLCHNHCARDFLNASANIWMIIICHPIRLPDVVVKVFVTSSFFVGYYSHDHPHLSWNCQLEQKHLYFSSAGIASINTGCFYCWFPLEKLIYSEYTQPSVFYTILWGHSHKKHLVNDCYLNLALSLRVPQSCCIWSRHLLIIMTTQIFW